MGGEAFWVAPDFGIHWKMGGHIQPIFQGDSKILPNTITPPQKIKMS